VTAEVSRLLKTLPTSVNFINGAEQNPRDSERREYRLQNSLYSGPTVNFTSMGLRDLKSDLSGLISA